MSVPTINGLRQSPQEDDENVRCDIYVTQVVTFLEEPRLNNRLSFRMVLWNLRFAISMHIQQINKFLEAVK